MSVISCCIVQRTRISCRWHQRHVCLSQTAAWGADRAIDVTAAAAFAAGTLRKNPKLITKYLYLYLAGATHSLLGLGIPILYFPILDRTITIFVDNSLRWFLSQLKTSRYVTWRDNDAQNNLIWQFVLFSSLLCVAATAWFLMYSDLVWDGISGCAYTYICWR
jgi:hypothetical protein